MPTPASIIQKLKQEGVLKCYADFRAGSGYDLSGSGNHFVPSGSGVSQTIRGMRILAAATTCSVPASTGCALLSGAGAVIWFGGPATALNSVATVKTFVIKGLGVTTDWGLNWLGGNLRVTIGATSSAISVTQTVIETAKALAFNYTAGNKPELYMNGLLAGLGTNVVTVSTDNPGIFAATTTVGATGLSGLTQAVLVISRRLTSTEHSLLYHELTNLTFPTVQ
jgi:hypothetical protein